MVCVVVRFMIVPRTFSAGWRLSLGCIRVWITWGPEFIVAPCRFDLTTIMMYAIGWHLQIWALDLRQA